jgi:hypothetical protein
MYILGHNPSVWALVLNGLQGDPQDNVVEQLKRIQLNAQACDILFNSLCPKEFNKISCLESAKDIWDTVIEIHEGMDSVKESNLDILSG